GLAVDVVTQAPGQSLTAAAIPGPLVWVTEALPPPATAALREALLAGKTVVAAPKNAAAAESLAPLLGLTSLGAAEATVGNYALWAEIEFQHPLFAPFADPRF